MLPQGFKNSPTIFGEVLAKDLRDVQLRSGVLLQYVDDLLIASRNYEDCLHNTITVLNHLAKRGYKVSPHKAQICKQEVAYLGFQLKQGTRSLMADRKQAIATLKIPENRRQLRGFLGITGFCRIWIPNFGLIAKPLYNSLKGLVSEPLEWTRDCQVAFDTLKEKLASAPALGLPDLQKPFKLYIHERQGIGLGVLTQTLGNIPRPIAYLSKKLDHTTKGWPWCLRAVAATCDILQ